MDQPPKPASLIPIGERIPIQGRKIMVGQGQDHNQDSPDLSPLFVNNVEVLQVGTDFYLDLGIIRPDEIALAGVHSVQQRAADEGSSPKPTVLDFFVLERIVMSEHTFRMLMLRGNAYLELVNQRDQESE